MKNDTFNAFVTVHWFATGYQVIANSDSSVTDALYAWYLEIDNRDYANKKYTCSYVPVPGMKPNIKDFLDRGTGTL